MAPISYRNNQRNQRKLITETNFGKGMNYSNNPLLDGQARVMVNLIQRDYGDTLRPRGAWVNNFEPIDVGPGMLYPYVHHTGTALVTNTDSDDVALMRYALVVDNYNYLYATLANSIVLIEEPETPEDIVLGKPGIEYKVSTHVPVVDGATKVRHRRFLTDPFIHGHRLDDHTPEGMHASISGNTYLMTDLGLARLDLFVTNAGAYTHKVELVEALEPSPMEAVNYGYNMLLSAPYTFSNASGPVFKPKGIIPYEPGTTNILLNARAGQPIEFVLYYDYVSGVNYKVQWEIQDINRQGDPNVIQKATSSSSYSNGSKVSIEIAPEFKQFTVIARVYVATDMVNPIREVVLASYNLADDKTKRQELNNYDLSKSRGICTWQNQMVYWGAQGMEMSVMISDINDPTYVPFPNNNIDFNERVLKCFPHQENLMVATESGFYLVGFDDTNTGFVKKLVQGGLNLREEDTLAMFSMRNMVYFKSQNYYFMIVPNTKSLTGELQLAPVSTPVNGLLDDFKNQAYDIIRNVYPLNALLSAASDTLDNVELSDYHCTADGNRIRNIYKFKFTVGAVDTYVDLQLLYDTIFRTWTVELLQSNASRITAFDTLATTYAQFVNVYDTGLTKMVQLIDIDELQAADTFALTSTRVVDNIQYLDTGKRALDPEMKKRFRHIVFEINNLDGVDLEFNHQFMLDDETRTDLFTYAIEQELDPLATNYGQIYVVKDYEMPETLSGELNLVYQDPVDPTKLYGITALNSWLLSASAFPDKTVQKVFLEVSGKGYYPRFKLLTQTPQRYELNHISWAYRDMGAR